MGRNNIRILGEKDKYKYLRILEADITKQKEMKDKVRKEHPKRIRELQETKLCSENLIKPINKGNLLYKILWTLLKLDKEENKHREIDDDVKGFTLNRWHLQILCNK